MNEQQCLKTISLDISAPKAVSEDGQVIEYAFSCEAGCYDVYVRHAERGESIYSRATVAIDDAEPVCFIRYPWPPTPYWMQVDRVELEHGRHRLVFHQVSGMGFNPEFTFDAIELRPASINATHWRWGVTRKYAEGMQAEQQLRMSLKTPAQVKTYQQRVHDEFTRMLGSIPTQKTDLHPEHTGTIQRDGYRIEKIVFQSRPAYYVPGLLYIPDQLTKKAPAVLHLPGHSPNGKAWDDYQRLCSGLACKGYVVFNIDPINQGERGPYYTLGNTHEGQGLQGFVAHDLNPGYFIWDAVRAIDYLQSRSEVDHERIGVTGISGGGVQTMLLAFYDERVKGAVGMGGPLPTETALWSSYDPDGTFNDVMKPYGATNEAMVSCIAPRGFVIQNGAYDSGFPASSGLDLFQEAQHFYKILDAEDMLACEWPEAGHETNLAMRQNVYKWFNKFLNMPHNDNVECGAESLPESETYCTPTGLVDTSYPDAESIWSLRLKKGKAQRVDVAMRRADATKSKEAFQLYKNDIRKRVKKVLNCTPVNDPLNPSIISKTENRRTVCFQSQPPMRITADIWFPDEKAKKPPIVVYCNQTSTNPEEGWIKNMNAHGWVVCSVHVRLTPKPGQTLGERMTSAAHGGVYPLAMKTIDLLRASEYLRSLPELDSSNICYFGDGEYSGLAALFAGLLDDKAAKIVCDTELVSLLELLVQQTPNRYEAKIEDPMYLPGAMAEFDVVDLAAALAPTPLLLIAPDNPGLNWHGAKRPEFKWANNAYTFFSAGQKLERLSSNGKDRLNAITEWITGKQ
jgi:cephalosporin-C deacetylase-like acetyl esterase